MIRAIRAKAAIISQTYRTAFILFREVVPASLVFQLSGVLSVNKESQHEARVSNNSYPWFARRS